MAVATKPTAPAEPTPSDLVSSAPPSPAGPAEPGDLARLPGPPPVPLPRALQVLRFNQRQIEFVFRARRELGEVFRMRGIVAGEPGGHQPSRPRALAVHGQARAGAVADRRVAAAPDRRRQLGADRASARATCASASCCCRRSTARRSSATRQMIADAAEREIDRWPIGRAVRARAAHAGDHARRDHGRDLRHRGPAAAGHARARPAHRDQAAAAPRRPGRSRRSPSCMNIGSDEPVGPDARRPRAPRPARPTR